MLIKSHVVITIFFCFLLFQNSSDFVLFLFISIIATILPDLDTPQSKIGKKFKLFNFFMKHRGIIHSFTFLLIISLIILLFWNKILFPFILGYSLHLVTDALTLHGIRLFYPLKLKIPGFIKTGGIFELILFIVFSLMDLFLLINKLYSVL